MIPSIRYLLLLSLIPAVLSKSLAAHPSRHLESRDDTSFPLVPEQAIEALDTIRQRWGVGYVGLAITASPGYVANYTNATAPGDGWLEQRITLGQANAKGDEFEEDTLFAIASNSKHFSALAIGLLINDNTTLSNGKLLTLNSKIKDILPEWGMVDEYAAEHMEPVDLMAHRTGLPRHDGAWSAQTPFDIVNKFKYLRPSTEFRKAGQYSNLHYIVLDAVISTLTNVSLPEFVTERIFKPLGMDSTTYSLAYAREESGKAIVDGWTLTNQDLGACQRYLNSKDVDVQQDGFGDCSGNVTSIGWWSDEDQHAIAAGGGIISNLNDMSKWLRELLSPSVIPPAVLASTAVSYTLPTGDLGLPGYTGVTTWGLGQFVYTYRGFTLVGHDGSLYGQKSLVVRFPDAGLAFVLAVGAQYYTAQFMQAVLFTLADELLGLEKTQNWEQFYFEASMKALLGDPATSSTNVTKVPEVRPPLEPSAVTGRYSDQGGYGDLNIIPLSEYTNTSIIAAIAEVVGESATATTTNPNLSRKRAENGTSTDPATVFEGAYIAEVDETTFTHMAFIPTDGPIYSWFTFWVSDKYAQGGDLDGLFAMTVGLGTAIFQDNGVGLWGIWGAGATVVPKVPSEEDVERNAEVWYKRV